MANAQTQRHEADRGAECRSLIGAADMTLMQLGAAMAGAHSLLKDGQTDKGRLLVLLAAEEIEGCRELLVEALAYLAGGCDA